MSRSPTATTALHVLREAGGPHGRDAPGPTRRVDLGLPERTEEPEVVQHHDDAGSRDVEDRVNVEIVLRRLVVVGKLRLVEDRARFEGTRSEHDVPTEVVPCADVAEVDDSPDAGRLGVPNPALGIRVQLAHSTSLSASITSAGWTFSRHRAPTGQVRGCQADRGERT